MAKTAQKLFGDGGHHTGDLRISKEQVRYTFWKKLRLDVSEADVDRFFLKYTAMSSSRGGGGEVILLSDLMTGIVKNLGANEPLIDDKNYLSPAEQVKVGLKVHQCNSLESFFTTLR